MKSLARFQDIARKAGVVTRVTPAPNHGVTAISATKYVLYQTLSQSVTPVTSVTPKIRNDWTQEDWQAAFDERAGILEYDEGVPRCDAEMLARDQILGC